ncbi:hypothetical protein AB0K11_03900 [Mycobacterium sp. NPDC050551]|uniref:hypothetical protein n=1 Tax=Mycobacterium sp. NPDC050551 TaxID=3155407 RepID=UPI00343592EE
MTVQFDVAGRLADGQPAVDTLDTYVSACAALGFEHPDLTAHADQVHGWYGSEAGMDLRALDADCARLRAAVAATEQARDVQDGTAGALADSWAGSGGQSAREFLRRHGDASATATAALAAAADVLTDLRDRLWHSVDARVQATQAIADTSESVEWEAAARTVLTGAGDRVAASELVDLRVKPFVAEEVGNEWVSAMRAGTDDVVAAYDAATTKLAAEPATLFEVPADWGPAAVHTVPAGVVETTVARLPFADSTDGGAPASGGSPAWSVPAAGAAPSQASPLTPTAGGPAPAAMEPAVSAAEPPAPSVNPAAAAPAPSSAPAMGGLPDVGSGLSGMGQQFADMLGGLLGSSGDALSGVDELESPDDEGADPRDEEAAVEEPGDDSESDSGAGVVNPAGGGGSPAPTEAAGSTPAAPECAETSTPSRPAEEPVVEEPPVEEPPAEPPPTPPPPAGQVAAAEPVPPSDQAATPCEIAADEVPQAGE